MSRIAVSSSKGQIGHTLGAAGAVEAAITALAIARGVMPPTGGLEEVDPACQLLHLKEAREAPIRAAMSNSFGFGGTDSVLVFTQPDRFPPPLGVGSPSLGQVEPPVDQRVPLAAAVRQEHPDLAILDPTSRAAVLALHTDALRPFLQEASLVND